ncbi:bacillithiol biosynthesis protein BshC [Holophaga foetida]|uniref:bacillithiol biosynthesis protein BshC n=1 Tax=Holophaga foetida TaxID=35839 RepID=UPI00024749B5|nr:bacillithiol biosynthesis BshC [Holophaga foetida]
MEPQRAILTGQQIGAGWTPALSVVKALTALVEARRKGLRAIYWMADEDHDRQEVAQTVGLQGQRLVPHRFRFQAPEGTATGWLPWMESHQGEAETLWGPLPQPASPDLRGHALALGQPLWDLGIEPFSPTRTEARASIQAELERWRALDLESDLFRQAERLVVEGAPLPLDPRNQAAWFRLDPRSGIRRRLDRGELCPRGWWLSPGAALRPLMQSLLLPVEGAVLGPAERAYWRLAEPLWERVGLQAPRIIPRPTVYLVPPGLNLDQEALAAIQAGRWEAFRDAPLPQPSERLGFLPPDPAWGKALTERFEREMARTKRRLEKLDRRLLRDAAAHRFGGDPERLRQQLFPFDRPQERVLPGIHWLRDPQLLQRIMEGLESGESLVFVDTLSFL